VTAAADFRISIRVAAPLELPRIVSLISWTFKTERQIFELCEDIAKDGIDITAPQSAYSRGVRSWLKSYDRCVRRRYLDPDLRTSMLLGHFVPVQKPLRL
jgi:hypothetical protein